MPTIYENMCNPETHKRKVDFDNHYTYLAYYLFKNSNGDVVKGEPHIILLEKEISDKYKSYIKGDIEDSYRWSKVKGEVVIEEISDDYFGAESFFKKVKSVGMESISYWNSYFPKLGIEDVGHCKVLTYDSEESFINNYFFVDDFSVDKDSAKFMMINLSNKKFFITISNDYIGIYQDTFFNCTPYLFGKKIEGLIDDNLIEFMSELEELLNIKIIYTKKHIISAYQAIKNKKEEEDRLELEKNNRQLRLIKSIKILFFVVFIMNLFINPMHTLLFIGSIVYYVYMAALAFWIFVVFARGLLG